MKADICFPVEGAEAFQCLLSSILDGCRDEVGQGLAVGVSPDVKVGVAIGEQVVEAFVSVE